MRRHAFPARVLLCVASAAAALPAGALPSGATLEVLWVGDFSAPRLNETGHVAFLWGGGGDSGLSAGLPGNLVVIAREDDPAPGGAPGETYATFSRSDPITNAGPPVLNDAGQLAFHNAFNPPDELGGNNAIWGPGAGGELALIARVGHSLPGDGSGAVISSFGLPTLDDAGRTAFVGRLQIGSGGVTSANDAGLWRTDGTGIPSLVAREGDAAPGTAPGTVFSGSFAQHAHGQSDAGIAFSAGTSAGSGIFAPDGGGGLAPIALGGGAAPGTGGAVFGNLSAFGSAPALDDAGRVTFQASLQTGVGGVTTANDSGIWGLDGSGQLALIAREGGQAPGTPAGAVFGSFAPFSSNGAPFEHGNAGIAFGATLVQGIGGVTDANDTGLWRTYLDSDAILLAREGDAVPTLPGATFAEFTGFASFYDVDSPVINDQGETAFVAGLTVGDGGVTTSNDRALFYADAGGNLTMLLREGDFIPSLGNLSDFALETGALNDARQLLVRGQFDFGVSALMLIAIPEPSAALLLGFGLGGLAAARRRRRV